MSMDQKSALQIARASESSPLIWAASYLKLPKDADWDFNDRRWQLDIFDDPSRNIVVMKPTQIGLTTIMISRMLWFLNYNHARGMYTFPRRDDVIDFVTSRFEVMVENSPTIKRKMRGADNVRLKAIGDSFLHFQEASVPPRMLDVDKLINDEIDLSDPEMLAQYPSRLDASRWKIHHKLSTPTIPGYGIDALYSRTDKKVWMVKCPGCSRWQKMTWKHNLNVKDDKAWYGCRYCKRVLAPWDIDAGAWVAEESEYSGYESGYHINQMMMPISHPPQKMWDLYKTTPIKWFYNLRLGEPFRPPGGSLTRDIILDNVFDSTVYQHEEYPEKGFAYYIAFDQGNDLYALVGKYVDEQMVIVKAEVFPFEELGGWDRIADLYNTFKPRLCLGDAHPNRHSARDMITPLPRGRAYLASPSETASQWNIDKKNRMVHYNRTEMLDRVRDTIVSGGVRFSGMREPLYPDMSTITDHLVNMERDEQSRRTSSGEKIVGVWRKVGHDHFFHTLGYLLVAHSIKPAGVIRMDVIGGVEKRPDEKERKKSIVWRGLH